MDKTHIILVHGAYHTAWCFHLLRQQLEGAGYAVSTPQMPSAGHNIANGTLAEDTETIKAAIESAADTAERIIPVFHSYGGIPGSDAVAELSDSTKARIFRLVYLASFVLEPGTALTTPAAGRTAPWSQRDGPTLSVPDPMTVFYHDVQPLSLAREACDKVVKQAYQPMFDNAKHRGWKEFPATYVFCAKDRAAPMDRIRTKLNSMLVEHGMQERWELLTVDSGHSPFLSMPEECARIVRRAAGEDVTLEHTTVGESVDAANKYDQHGYVIQTSGQ